MLAGELPSSLGKLTNMTKFSISDNGFSGNIAELTTIYRKYYQSFGWRYCELDANSGLFL